jgi:cyclase
MVKIGWLFFCMKNIILIYCPELEVKMKVERIGSRGYLFTFDDLLKEHGCDTRVYVINGERHFFICDTYLGTDIVKTVMGYMNENCGDKKVIVFNSHSDWDHIWGNCFFKDEIILSHESCVKRIDEFGTGQLEEFKAYHRGKVEVVKPNLTFESEIYFPEEGIRFFYSPGHTVDSSSCLDEVDKALYAGDNLEYPNPYIQWDNLREYQRTLERYLSFDIDIFISCHSGIFNREMVRKNLEYIKGCGE